VRHHELVSAVLRHPLIVLPCIEELDIGQPPAGSLRAGLPAGRTASGRHSHKHSHRRLMTMPAHEANAGGK
jgi:hypothetical protein